MSPDRLTKVGIQRELRMEWFDQAVRFHAMGLKKNAARQEIYAYLDGAPGFATSPSSQTKIYIANSLIKSWIYPERDLAALRDAAFQVLQENSDARLALHWCLLGSAYPFWFAVASVTGRLLNLQEQVTQGQLVTRLKEKFGDRETISRRARYVIRSFVVWGVLKDSNVKGCYEKASPLSITDSNLATLMLESVLLTTPEAKSELNLLLNNPALFPFRLPTLTGDFIAQHSQRINVDRYGLDNELLTMKVASRPIKSI